MIFLSHSKKDSGVTLQLATELEAAGWQTWYYERDCLPGPTHLLQTHEAIVTAECVLIVVTLASMRSPHVEAELFAARDCFKPVVPIFFGISFAEMRREPPDWDQAIGAHVGIELAVDGLPAVLPRLLAGLRKLLQGRKFGEGCDPEAALGQRPARDGPARGAGRSVRGVREPRSTPWGAAPFRRSGRGHRPPRALVRWACGGL